MPAKQEPHPEWSERLLSGLLGLLGTDRFRTDLPTREGYAWDNTGLRWLPQGVALPETATEVAAILSLCHQARFPVVPRGAGSGNVGGALAVQGGLVLSTQRLNRVIEINPADRLAVVEPGVVNRELQELLAPHALFWPPDPSSARVCTVGGNLAMCAAGPGAVRYGVTRDWVLGLTAVLADGTIIRCGGRTSKGVVGYDLTRLLVGSEGTLAVVTQATLKLAPRPEARRQLRLVFAEVATATRAVVELMSRGDALSAIEFLDAACLGLLRDGGGMAIPVDGRAMLLLEVAGDAAEVGELATRTAARVAALGPLETVVATNAEESRQVWEAREALSPTLKRLAPKRINEDVVVPVSRLPELIAGLERISRESGIPIVNFGHAGNGNIHVNLLVDATDNATMRRVEPVLKQIFGLVMTLEGSLSGEHGVGVQKRPFVAMEMDPAALALQKRIKALFDPRAILNPGKLLP
ncbi:MAG: FAD-binding protein [Magnetococcales bacterium]|nr:FAD-binding protein [Magnetococcales bacterium]MBF0156139.1 FAD-binding protein [Magnetococcales bacterium]